MCVVERKRESDGVCVCVYVLDDALVVSLCVRARVCARVCTYTHSVVYVCMYIYIYVCVCVCV